jgi:hypothetical protein
MADRLSSANAEIASRTQSRPAVIVAGLLYLIAAHQRTPCPCLAGCIVRHLECLARHEAADPVIRQICHAIRDTWALAAAAALSAPGTGPRSRVH